MSPDARQVLNGLIIGLITIICTLVMLALLERVGAEQARTPSTYQRELLQLDKEAVKEAYKEHAKKLFNNWIVDSTGQPDRMITGLRTAQQAYIGAMVEINKYEQELGR